MSLRQKSNGQPTSWLHSQHAVALTGRAQHAFGHPRFSQPQLRAVGAGGPDGGGLRLMASSAIRTPSTTGFGPLAKQMVEAQPQPRPRRAGRPGAAGRAQGGLTQNIDELHYRAGSRRVLELHGSVRTATCTRLPGTPADRRDVARDSWRSAELPPCPRCGDVLKPDVVLFGELLPAHVLEEAQQEAERSDVMLVAGSSLEVYPAAGLAARVRLQAGARRSSSNYEPTAHGRMRCCRDHGRCGGDLPRIAAQVRRTQRERHG